MSERTPFFLLVLEMDVVGSAFATSVSICLCSAVAMIPFLRRKTLLQFTKPKFSAAMCKEIAAYGSPSFLIRVGREIRQNSRLPSAED